MVKDGSVLGNLMNEHPNPKGLNCKRLSGKPLNKYIDKLLAHFKLPDSTAFANRMHLQP